MSKYKISKYQQYTYDPQEQVDKCLECKKTVSECNRCSADPNAKHRDFLYEKVKEAWERGLDDTQIAEELGKPRKRVVAARNRLNLLPNGNVKNKRVDYEQIIKLWEQGLSDSEIAQKMGCGNHTVWSYRKRHNMPANNKVGGKRQ